LSTETKTRKRKPALTENNCPTCAGTGLVTSKQLTNLKLREEASLIPRQQGWLKTKADWALAHFEKSPVQAAIVAGLILWVVGGAVDVLSRVVYLIKGLFT
jgi:hypothetical protein